jgi:hypothetical protein
MKDLNSGFASDMVDSDFFLKDYETGNEVYNPANVWNLLSTTGAIAHLIQPNNTLSAEVDIAAQATVIRKNDKGKIITDADELINCSKYGNPGRNSDPSVRGFQFFPYSPRCADTTRSERLSTRSLETAQVSPWPSQLRCISEISTREALCST